MKKNLLKAKLQAGKPVLAAEFCAYWPEMVEIIALLGIDCAYFDAEHGAFTLPQISELVRAAEAAGITPIARTPSNAADVIVQYLDAGVQGIIVPLIHTREDAERAVRAIKYYPEGERGCGYTHSLEWGLKLPFAEYVKEANQETLTILMCECKEALENLSEIVKVPGVDIIAAGPSDLAQSLGIPGQVDHPREQAALARIKDTTLGAGKWFMAPGYNGEDARQRIGKGQNMVTFLVSDALISGLRDYVSKAKAGL